MLKYVPTKGMRSVRGMSVGTCIWKEGDFVFVVELGRGGQILGGSLDPFDCNHSTSVTSRRT